ncbi:bifunctional folylpolyglutamate synthase/dihydrofolate synthase [Acidobacteria bacterium AB60]|nr:bifunctional folylpolyglutamate synthase/dihydrofolate synthase [Acidobacteria bacterium AB60]
MSYAAAIDALNAMAPELYTRPGAPRRKFSLAEIGTLLAHLGNPQHRFPAVLIAGTNGKGSTAATLASILSAAGLRTGLYTSPHLERVNERVRVNGAEIADSDFARLFFTVRTAAENLVASGTLAQMPSFFEVLTALAFLHFAEQHIEIAVLEVGLGGRLDATNIVNPRLSVITDISLDHMEWLGSTISAITREKAGILRPHGILVTLPQHPEANQVLGEVATELEVRGVSATPYMPALGTGSDSTYAVEVMGLEIEVNSPLAGAHQHRNVALAIAAAVELAQNHQVPVTPAAIAEGIRATRWPGRLERFRTGSVTWILDVAHNPAGAWALRAGLRDRLEHEFEGRPKTLIFSCLRDKPVEELAQILFPVFDQVLFAPIASPRAVPLSDLKAAAESTGTSSQVFDSVGLALDAAARRSEKGLVVVSGSVYLVGDARHALRETHPASASR